MKCLELIAEGHDNHAISVQLGVSEKAVIFSKLDISSRAQAVARARKVGIGQRRSD
jgi:DNA-binding NarL/FixJ family response regulator